MALMQLMISLRILRQLALDICLDYFRASRRMGIIIPQNQPIMFLIPGPMFLLAIHAMVLTFFIFVWHLFWLFQMFLGSAKHFFQLEVFLFCF